MQTLPRTARRPAQASRSRAPSERLVLGVSGFVAVLVIWEAASRLLLIKKAVFSSPSLIWEAAMKDIASGVIWTHILVSGQEYVFGMALALLVGIPVGLALGLVWRANYLVDPWLSAIYATPLVALVPLIILIFGIGLEAKVIVVFLEAVFVIVVSVINGVHSTELRYHDIAQSFRASRSMRFRTVVLPAAVPFILTGTRLGTGRGIVGVVVAEFLAANAGIGFYISLSGSLLQSARVYFGIVLLGTLGLLLGELLRRAERRFDRWRPTIN